MNATDLWLDDYYASDFGLMIGSIGDSNDEVASGGDIEYSVAKPPNRDKHQYYTSQYNEPLSWNITLFKNPCKTNDMTITCEEERRINKWLKKTNEYRWIRFIQEGYEDVFYHVNINVKPNQVNGHTIGFDLVITSDCGYGFSRLITQNIEISSSTSSIFYIDTDVNEYVYPEIIIQNNNSENFFIQNKNDKETIRSNFYNLDPNTDIFMQAEKETITGVMPEQFSWNFIRLVDGKNELITDSTSNIRLQIRYREARMVII